MTIDLDRPVVIGGTGGSGTRVFQQIFENSGFFMGAHLNDSQDALNFMPVLGHTISGILQHTRTLDYALEQLPPALASPVLDQLSALIEAHKREIPPHAIGWGWKNPRFIYLLPFLHRLYPRFRFVHVVRDGRDIALSSNQQQLQHFYPSLFGTPPQIDAVHSIRMWQEVNLGAYRFARAAGMDYTLVRYEDMCLRPEETIARLARIFSLPTGALETMVKDYPFTLGKFRSLDPPQRLAIRSAGEGALRFFGYIPPS